MTEFPNYTEGDWWPIGDSDPYTILDFTSKYKGALRGVNMAFDDLYSDPNTSILDFMGYGHIIKDMNRRGVSVSLATSTRQIPHVKQIAGDVLEEKTWKTIQRAQKTTSPEGFNLILANPIGALELLPNSRIFYLKTLIRLMKMLSPDGVLIGEASASELETTCIQDTLTRYSSRFHFIEDKGYLTCAIVKQ